MNIDFSSLISAVIGGLITAVGSYFVFIRQVKTKIREDIKNRKLAAYNKGIDCVAELIGIISVFSAANKNFRKVSGTREDIETLFSNPVYVNNLRKADPEAYQQLMNLFGQYQRIITETWKVNGLLRLNFDKEHSDKLEDLVDYLNSLREMDLSDSRLWDEMKNRCYSLVDIMAEEIRRLEELQSCWQKIKLFLKKRLCIG